MDEAQNAGHSDAEHATEAFSERVLAAALGFADTVSLGIGLHLGWYAHVDAAGPAGLSCAELAARAGTDVRYTQEWLEQQAVTGLLRLRRTPEAPDRFVLPPGAAPVLLDASSLALLAPMIQMLLTGVRQLPELLDAYRAGGGVPWAERGDAAREAQADGNKPWFEQRLAPALDSVPELAALLRTPGVRIADVGAGYGWSTLALAEAYPRAVLTGLDIDAPSVARARDHAAARELGDRVRFVAADADQLATLGPFELVVMFEALHDLPYPVGVLRAIRDALAPQGTVVIMDEAVATAFAPDGDAVERLMYAYSLLICLPDSLAAPGSVGTGTVLRPQTLRQYAAAAGFARVEELPITDFSVFRFYRLHR